MAETIHRAGVSWQGGEGDDGRVRELCFIANSVQFPIGVEPA